MRQDVVNLQQGNEIEYLKTAVSVSFILAILIPPVGLVLGLAKRRDYGHSLPRNRRAATYIAGVASILIVAWMGTVLYRPVSSLIWLVFR